MRRFSNFQIASFQLRENFYPQQPTTNGKAASKRASRIRRRTMDQNIRRFDNFCSLFWTIKTVKILFGREKINRKRTLVDRAFPIDLELETRKRSIKQIQRKNYPKRKSTGSEDALNWKYIIFSLIFLQARTRICESHKMAQELHKATYQAKTKKMHSVFEARIFLMIFSLFSQKLN